MTLPMLGSIFYLAFNEDEARADVGRVNRITDSINPYLQPLAGPGYPAIATPRKVETHRGSGA